MKKRKIMLDILMIILFIVGIGALAYPFVSDSVNNYLNQQVINYYQNKANEENFKQMADMQAEMERKNQEIAKQEVQAIGTDPFDEENLEEVVETPPLDYYEENTIGIITIPDINVRLPIFNETNALFLEKGATLLEGTSFPTGGKSTHSVITSHAGLTEARLFTDLEDMVEGTQFFIDINNRTLAYEVDQIKVVLPTELDDVKIVEGEDYVTLLTCTPYMINTHRLLVRGRRIEYLPDVGDEMEKVATSKKNEFIFWGVATFVFVAFVLYLLYKTFKNYFISHRNYDLKAVVLDKESNPIPHVEFELLNKRMKPVKKNTVKMQAFQSDENGVLRLNDLPGGQYILYNAPADFKVKIYVRKIKDSNFTIKKIKNDNMGMELIE